MTLEKYYEISNAIKIPQILSDTYDCETILRERSFSYSNFVIGSNLPVPWQGAGASTSISDLSQYALYDMMYDMIYPNDTVHRNEPTLGAWQNAGALYYLGLKEKNENAKASYDNWGYTAPGSVHRLTEPVNVETYFNDLKARGAVDKGQAKIYSNYPRFDELRFEMKLSDPIEKNFKNCTLYILLFPYWENGDERLWLDRKGLIHAYWDCEGQCYPVISPSVTADTLTVNYFASGPMYIFPHLGYTFSSVYEMPCFMLDMGIYYSYWSSGRVPEFGKTYQNFAYGRTLLGICGENSPTRRKYTSEEIFEAHLSPLDFWEMPLEEEPPRTAETQQQSFFRVSDPKYDLKM